MKRLAVLTAICILAIGPGATAISGADTATRVFFIDGRDNLCSIGVSGSDERCYGRSKTASFSFSPDGKQVAYLAEDNSISLVDTGSHEKRVLLKDRKDKYSIEWSPDSGYIAYVVADEDTNNDGKIDGHDGCSIGIVGAQSEEVFVPVKSGADTSSVLFWSKDGTQLYYSRLTGVKYAPKLQLMRADRLSGEKKLLAEKDDNVMSELGCGALHINQHNIPDQEKRDTDMLVGTNMHVYSANGEIFLNDRKRGKVRKLVEHISYDAKYNPGYYNPRWLTRTKIVFVGKGAVWLMDAKTSNKKKLAKGGSPGGYMMPSNFNLKTLMPVTEGGECIIPAEK